MKLTSCLIISLAVLFFLSEVYAGTDFYEILGVKRDASKQEIKKVYRNLAKIWHPDKHPDADKPAASAKYQEITHAYEVLSDDQKRRTYDQYGEEGLKKNSNSGGGFGFDDVFSNFGFNFGGGNNRNTERKGESLVIDLEVSLEDLYIGKTIIVSHRKQTLCPICRGTGAKDPDDVQQCPVCKGSGVKVTVQRLGPGFVTQTQTTCDKCGGKGKIVKSVCDACQGSKLSVGEETITVVVERGMHEDSTITFSQEADQSPETIPGDLIFRIKTQPHTKFSRRENDLVYKATISLVEALTGFTKQIKHLDGHIVTLSRTEVTKPGFTMVVPGEGMPIHEMGGNGDLYVEFTVRFPRTLTQQQKDTVKQLFS